MHMCPTTSFPAASPLRIAIIATSQPLTQFFTARFFDFQANITAQAAALESTEVSEDFPLFVPAFQREL